MCFLPEMRSSMSNCVFFITLEYNHANPLMMQKCSPDIFVVLITPPPVDEEGRKEIAISLYGVKAMTVPERTNNNCQPFENIIFAASQNIYAREN
ncbi:unnamed protein product [Rhodiola kirilowii]